MKLEEAITYAIMSDGHGKTTDQIKSYLFANGFVWSEDQQQFRPIGYDA